GSALHPFGCRAHVLDARRRRLIRAEGSSGLAEGRPTAVWDCRMRVRAAARTLCGGIGIFPEDRTEDWLSRSARGKVTVAGSNDLGILSPSPSGRLCLHRAVLSWLDRRSGGSVP